MRASKGLKRGTRHALTNRKRNRGKLKISDLLKDFENNERVVIAPHPSHHSSLPIRRIYGKAGVIKEKRGSCYVVTVKQGKKEKEFILSPAHIRGVK